MSISFNDFIGEDTIILTGNIPNPDAQRLMGSMKSFSFVLTDKKLMHLHYESISILPLKNIKEINISPVNIVVDKFVIAYGPENAELAKRLFNEIAKRIV